MLARLDVAADRSYGGWFEQRPIVIPAADEDRFLTDFLPAVRRRAVWSDGRARSSCRPPDPQLLLSVTFRPEHRVRLDWSVRYDRRGDGAGFGLDDSPRAPPAARPGGRARAVGRSRPAVRRLPLLADPDRPGRRPRTCCWPVRRGDLRRSRSLPELEAAGVAIETDGEPVDYRRPSSEPVVEVSTAAETGPATGSTCRSGCGSTVRWSRSRSCSWPSATGRLLDHRDRRLPAAGRPGARAAARADRGGAAAARPRPARAADQPGPAGLWDELIQLGVVLRTVGPVAEAVRGLLTRACPVGDEMPRPCRPGSRAELRPYQEKGSGG